MATNLTLTQLVGPVETPLGEKPLNGRLELRLPTNDSENGTVVGPVAYTIALDAEGDFTKSVWATVEGERSLSYAATLFWWDDFRACERSHDLGYIAIAYAPAPQKIADLLTSAVTVPVPTDILAEVTALANSAATSAATALSAANIVLDALPRSPRYFGVVGDGVTDDTAALTEALNYAGPLEWGDMNIRVTSPISISRAVPVSWRSNGARVFYDGVHAQRAVSLNCAGVEFDLDGRLTFDANAKSNNPFFVDNTSGGARPPFAANGLRVQNAYRASTAFSGGSGFWLRGGWRTIKLDRFVASNCRMAAGAGVAGVEGISGLTISANALYPDEIMLVNPEISEIYCEDATYIADQDGIKIFTAEDSATDPMPWPTHFNIVGGRFHNCRGRSIKSQCEMGIIQGAKFVRDAGWTSGGSPIVGGYEVDFQVGGGFLIDCEHHYRDYAPQALVAFSGTRETGGINRLSSGGTLRGSKVFLHNTPQMPRLVAFAPFAAEDFSITVSDVQVISTSALVNSVVSGSLTDTGGNENIRIDKFVGRIASSFVSLTGGGGTAIANVHVEDSINLATAVPVVSDPNANTINLFCRGVTGATNATQSKQSFGAYTITVNGADVAAFDSNSFDLFNLSLFSRTLQIDANTAGATGLINFVGGGGLRYVYDTRGTTGIELFSTAFPIGIGAGAGDGVTLKVDNGTTIVTFAANLVSTFAGPIRLASYSKTALPSPSPAGQIIHVSDDVGGPTQATSDGTNWRRDADRAVIA